jgi:tRNA pseudouridine55 synthase
MTGIICINKDKDITSFGAVAKVRGITKEKKCGHTGTLDPMATGVLPIMLGGATRFLNFLPDSDKGYRATFVLGKTTDTLDITGTVISEKEVNSTVDDVKALLPKYTGKIMQMPPMYSAKSVDGVRLYDLARQGIEVEREACEIEIKSLELVSHNDNEYVIDVVCSKGTYIRSLIDDIGYDLGCGAVMTALQRTMAMGFTLQDSITIDELQELKDSGKGFDDVLINLEDIYNDYNIIYVSDAQARRFANGGALDIDRLKKTPIKNEICAVYSGDNIFLGLGQSDGRELKVARLLTKRD